MKNLGFAFALRSPERYTGGWSYFLQLALWAFLRKLGLYSCEVTLEEQRSLGT